MSTMRTCLSRGMLGALAVMSFTVAIACGYDPHPVSGTLQCGSSNTCPEGYSCQSGRCWKDGAGGQGGSGGTTGTGGSAGSAGIDTFVGDWVFDAAASKRVRRCTDGTDETMMPYDDAVTISAGVGAPLLIGYYCGWNADVNGNTAVIRPAQSCDDLVMIPGTKFTFHGESLTLTTDNGATGMFQASLPYDYGPATGASTGLCTMTFTAPVTKN